MNNYNAFTDSSISFQEFFLFSGDQSSKVGWRWACDSKGSLLECDERVSDLIGYSSTFLINKPITTGIIDDGSKKAIKTALNAESFPYEVQIKMESTSGEAVEVVWRFLGERKINQGIDGRKRELFGISYLASGQDKGESKRGNYPESLSKDSKKLIKDPSTGDENSQEAFILNSKKRPKNSKTSSPTHKKRKKQHHSETHHRNTPVKFILMALPLFIFISFGLALYIERKGPSYQTQRTTFNFLEELSIKKVYPSIIDDDNECLLLYDSKGIEGISILNNMRYTLNSMRVDFDLVDVSNERLVNFEDYQTVVIAFMDLGKIADRGIDLMDWVNAGGRLLFALRPDPSPAFNEIYNKVGILEKSDDLKISTGLIFNKNLLPGGKSINLSEDFLTHSSFDVELDPQCTTYLTSADQNQLPLLWDFPTGDGRLVFINTDQFTKKDARGTLASAYSLLYDVFAYPVINSSMFFIDDFPAPIPEGKSPRITQEFGRDIQSFFINIWWPDMQSLTQRFGIKFTGVVIETYNQDVTPPFKQQSNVDLFNYFGSMLLQDGGEIGYHGYNHVPLCLKYEGCDDQLGYPYWMSEEAMRESLNALMTFNHGLFNDVTFSTYVPPSNILGDFARKRFPEMLPEVKIISSVYFPENDGTPYVQEFEEAEDGIIELPRITAGYLPDDFMRWAAVNELGMHYIQSHFVHPDDVLDEERSEGRGWGYLRKELDNHFLWLTSAAPHIRNMTAREGAKAVQRFSRLGVERESGQGEYRISLENFYDEGWLLLRSKHPIEGIEGGSVQSVGTDIYLINATSPEIVIYFED